MSGFIKKMRDQISEFEKRKHDAEERGDKTTMRQCDFEIRRMKRAIQAYESPTKLD